MEKISFFDEETNEEIMLEIIDQAEVDGKQYLLVADDEDNALIFKTIKDDDEEITYAIVEDDLELQKVTLIFLENDEYDIEV